MKDELFDKVNNMITAFKTSHAQALTGTSQMSQKLVRACNTIAKSWSGSFAGYHARLYYGNFETPTIDNQFSVEWGGINGIPDGWTERTPEEVKARIERITEKDFSLDELETSVIKLLSSAEDLRTEIVIQFSSFPFEESKEKELFAQIETFKFGIKRSEFIQSRRPNQIVTRDSEAILQGTRVPAHLTYEGIGQEAYSTCNAIEEFLKLSDRLVRQLEIKEKMSPSKDSTSNINNLHNLHPEIRSKCQELYSKKHYAEAVEKSFKVVRDRLRQLTGYETGSEAFGKGKLHIKGATAPHVDKDFNEGVRFLTMAIDWFRNEKAHTSDAKIDDPTRAYEYLRLSSLAMNLLENAEVKNEKSAG